MKKTSTTSSTSIMTFPLGGREFQVERQLWNVSDLKLDPSNPRLGYMLRVHRKGIPASDKELHDLLWEIDQVKDLYQSILQNGGLIEDPIIRSNGIVVEGNCRTVCLREIRKKYPKEPIWQQVWVRVLPQDVSEEQLMMLLGELHVAGKIEWRAFDQAEYVWKMNKIFGKNYDYLASHLRWSRSKLSQKILAYEETKAYIERTGDPQGINRFSHFEEFMKKNQLRERREKDPNFMIQFGDWVNQGKLPEALDIRQLPAILDNEDAYKVFIKDGIKKAAEVLYKSDPSIGSNLYSTLDRASSELENISLAEIESIKAGEEAKIQKIRRLAKAVNKVASFTGIDFNI